MTHSPIEMNREELLAELRNGKEITGVHLTGSQLRNSSFRGVRFERCEMVGVDATSTSWHEVHFLDGRLPNSKLEGSKFELVNFSSSILTNCHLENSIFQMVLFANVSLDGACLRSAVIGNSSVGGYAGLADFTGARISNSSIGLGLKGAKLNKAVIRNSHIDHSDLVGADLTEVKVDVHTSGFWLVPPEVGSFYAFKKVRDHLIVKLRVPANAKRSSATTRKCRVSRAFVSEIYEMDRSISKHRTGISLYDPSFSYTVGSWVEVPEFDDDRWNECSTGIHCFLTFDEAKTFRG